MKYWKIDGIWLQSMAALFVFGGILGGILAEGMAECSQGRLGIFGSAFLRQYKYLESDIMKLFCFLAGKRGKWVLLLWCAGFTGMALPIAAAFLLWQGISVGMLVALAGFRLGIRGIVIGCFALLPQTLLYLPAWFFFLFYVCRRECMQQIEGKRRAFAVYLAVLGLMSICTALGVLAESSINPWILKKLLHFLGY